jgi:PncC family amidohydrolase
MEERDFITGMSWDMSIRELTDHAEKASRVLIQKLKSLSLTLALAESCTAGLVSSLLAGVPGASAVLWGSFVCYTREAKVSMLGIDSRILDEHGLVSGETAGAMASGAVQKSGAYLAASVTGLAGPEGDGSNIAVGTVWAAALYKGETPMAREFHFTGSRNSIRLHAAIAVLELVNNVLNLNRVLPLDGKKKKKLKTKK